MPFKAVAFDLDGTLVTEKSSWWKLHEYFGTKGQSIENMQKYELGKITYDKFMRLDIELWQPRPKKETIEKVLSNYNLTPNSSSVIKTLIEREYSIFIVTTAPDLFANAVAKELNVKNIASNGFTFDEEGFLNSNATFNVDLINKDQAFAKMLSNFGIQCEECIAVGDSKYDCGFLNKAGLGLAFKPDDVLRGKAKFVIDDMREILSFI
jgi:HAD superfamily PSPase-like hydrolase